MTCCSGDTSFDTVITAPENYTTAQQKTLSNAATAAGYLYFHNVPIPFLVNNYYYKRISNFHKEVKIIVLPTLMQLPNVICR